MKSESGKCIDEHIYRLTVVKSQSVLFAAFNLIVVNVSMNISQSVSIAALCILKVIHVSMNISQSVSIAALCNLKVVHVSMNTNRYQIAIGVCCCTVQFESVE